MEDHRMGRRGQHQCMVQFSSMEVKELLPLDKRFNGDKLVGRLTLIVPSSVLAMTRRFKASVTKPVIQRSLPFGLEAAFNRSATDSGQGPTLNIFRFRPDCMFHM